MELEKIQKFETLANHETVLRNLAEEKGYRIKEEDVYRELVSGESIDSRPEMMRLLDNIYKGKYKGVLVFEVERLARGNTKDQGIVEEAFTMTDTSIITPSRVYDPQNEADEEYFSFGLFMSRREYKTIRRRMKAGTDAALQKGQFLGCIAPYGYRKVTVNKMKTLSVYEEEAKVVKMIFDMWIDERITTLQIALRLTRMGIPAQKGYEWESSVVNDIIKNWTYTGKIRWGYRKIVKSMEDGKVVKKMIRNKNPDIYEGLHDAIIPLERFELAQSLYKNNPPLRIKDQLKNPFASLLYCPKCNKRMQLKNSRGEYRYIHRPSALCNCKSAVDFDVHKLFIDALKEHIRDFEIKIAEESNNNYLEEYNKNLEMMKKELKNLQLKRTEIFEFLEAKLYTHEEFLERKTIITERIEKQEDAIKEAEKNVPEKIDYQERIVMFHQIIDLLESDPHANAKELNQLLKTFIDRIEYTREAKDPSYKRSRGGKIHLEIFFK